MIPITIYLFILIELLFVSWGDVKTDKIPNLWSIINILTFLIMFFVAPEFYQFSINVFILPLTFLVIGFFLFLLKIMGGGDSKFLSTLFLVVPYALHDQTFEYLLYSTILIGSFVFLTNLVKNFEKIILNLKIRNFVEVKSCFGSKFTYAPVILLSWLWLGIKIKILI